MQRVMVAVNGSQASLEAVKAACTLINPEGEIIAVDVEDIAQFYQDYALNAYGGALVLEPHDYDQEWEKEARQVHSRVEAIAQQYQVKLRWEVLRLEPGQGSVAEMINQAALKHHVRAIFVGRHRGAQFMEGLLGSVPRWLVTHSSLPVVVVPPKKSV
ncbi:universal stress protein [Sulfobacillus thermosulfidooxidans]|uniref:universal stress protein n=1 Tax=Sulfobacillus thermosulfidooxidans TaxID=28034 RepID=UPI00096BCB91|nr:universal stress protein [Sulfobacillus thermosulfidooxidans]OLZ11991.1 hypothetical protein BFX05_05830 [Sulfobacillus thermosulfidooxidans]OLZ16758.1 hypothetical protein BFX06_14765 [Sulfobacillus thermosulfidooxidans]OLZ20694.1 hypothetical protein BFX07_14515 [Sulfobacillus thermosulfidooxidans]